MSWQDMQKDFVRIGEAHIKCPICGKPDWCMVSKDGTKAICPRIKSPYKVKCGYVHQLTEAQAKAVKENMVIPTTHTKRLSPDALEKLHESFQSHLNATILKGMSTLLHIRSESLLDMAMGWSACYKHMTFPMYDENFDVVGILARTPMGEKKVIGGSQIGAFVPTNFRTTPGVTFICEGPTDTGAVNDLGLNSIGRFNCWAGQDVLGSWVTNHTVYVIADNDPDKVGLEGAQTLAAALAEVTRSIRVIKLPDAFKDVREMKIKLGHTACLRNLFNLCKA